MKKSFVMLAAVAAVLSAPAAAADGQDRRVVIQNISSQAINNLYASPITSSNWEEDMLGDNVIAAGASLTANIDNGTRQCQYDLKVVMRNGREHIRRNVNVCAISKWVIGDRGNSIN